MNDLSGPFPAVFVSHGMPTIVETPGPTRDFLRGLGRRLPRPSAVLCISAHFEGWMPLVTAGRNPETIHDFFGFPAFMYEKRYPAPGDPALADRVLDLLGAEGIEGRLEKERGMDHGAWVPLMLMYPEAEIPVVQLSVQTERGPRYHWNLGRVLAPLREEKVLILASGGATHNLEKMHGQKMNAPPPAYAEAFDAWLHERLAAGDTEALLDYEHQGPQAQRNHPYPAEHFLPLFVSLGAGGPSAQVRRLHSGFLYGVLSMAAYRWY